MTNKVHDTHLMLLAFLDLKKYGIYLSLIKFCKMKELTPIANSLHFQCFKLVLSGQVFHVLLINVHSLIYNQIDCFAFFFETHFKASILV